MKSSHSRLTTLSKAHHNAVQGINENQVILEFKVNFFDLHEGPNRLLTDFHFEVDRIEIVFSEILN